MQKKGIPADKQQIEAVMAAEEDAAVEMLQMLHTVLSNSENE